MKVIADKEVLDFLKVYLSKQKNKVVRIKLADACCGMAEFEVVYDVEREEDLCFELEGIKFVTDKNFGFLINKVELEKTPLGIDIKREFL